MFTLSAGKKGRTTRRQEEPVTDCDMSRSVVTGDVNFLSTGNRLCAQNTHNALHHLLSLNAMVTCEMKLFHPCVDVRLKEFHFGAWKLARNYFEEKRRGYMQNSKLK